MAASGVLLSRCLGWEILSAILANISQEFLCDRQLSENGISTAQRKSVSYHILKLCHITQFNYYC